MRAQLSKAEMRLRDGLASALRGTTVPIGWARVRDMPNHKPQRRSDHICAAVQPVPRGAYGAGLGISYGMAFTKGELLRHSIAFALRSVRLYGRRLDLTEGERLRVAAETIRELRQHGEWRELDDPVDGGPAATHPDD